MAVDDDKQSNKVDAVLRMSIGVIAAVVLYALFQSGLVPKITIGDATDINKKNVSPIVVLLIGFAAGFLERLVPDLFEKENSRQKPDV